MVTQLEESELPIDSENELTGRIIRAAMKVHSSLGPGLLESAYEACLAYELRKQGLKAATQVELPVTYGDVKLDVGYRMDVLVEDQIVVELKAIERILPVHKAQLLSYVRLSKKHVGLLINFHVEHLRDGVSRVIQPPGESLLVELVVLTSAILRDLCVEALRVLDLSSATSALKLLLTRRMIVNDSPAIGEFADD